MPKFRFFPLAHRFVLGSLTGLLLATGCSGADDLTADPAAADCQAAQALLDRCAAEYCDAHDDALCASLLEAGPGSIRHGQGSCGLAPADVNRLLRLDCELLVAEARDQAAGKADVPCPAYFPWCNQLAPGSAGFRVNLLDYTANQAQVEVLLPDVGRARVRGGGETWTTLRLQGAGLTDRVGAPAVPTVSFLLGVGHDVDLALVDEFAATEELVLDQLLLAPRQPVVLEDAGEPPFAYDAAAYALDEPWPTADYRIDPVSTWRNYRVVRVTVHPIRYNPHQRTLTVASRVRLSLSFSHGQLDRDTVDEGEAALASSYATTLVNYPEVAAEAGPRRDDPDRCRYLFIVHDPLLEAVQPLVDYKRQQGFAPEVKLLSQLGPDPAKLKEAITAAYQASAIEYVLLVGDVADLPSYTYPADPGNWQSEALPSDYWYSLLAGEDLFPELSVGRLSAKTPEELTRHVNRTLAHAQGDRAAAWRSRILLLAHEQQAPGKYQACSESVRTASYFNRDGFQFSKLYGGEHATNDQVLQALREGVGLLAYRGHGSEEAWYEWNGAHFSAGAQPLGNGDLTPVVLSIACLNAALDFAQPSHAEQWVLAPEGGAVAFLGATRPSWTEPNDHFERLLFRFLLNDNVTTLGPLLERARVALLAQAGNSSLAADNVKMYLWLGDPSLEVALPPRPAPPVHAGWCNLQWPPTLQATAGNPTDPIYTRVWAQGITEAIGQGNGVVAEIGQGPRGTDPAGADWRWTSARYNTDHGNNDEYQAQLVAPQYTGEYSYAARVRGAGDAGWTYCDQDGSHNGLDLENGLGRLTVQPHWEW